MAINRESLVAGHYVCVLSGNNVLSVKFSV